MAVDPKTEGPAWNFQPGKSDPASGNPGGNINFRDADNNVMFSITEKGVFAANGTKLEDAGELHRELTAWLRAAKVTS